MSPQDPDDDLARRFQSITIWKRGEDRAPHKPLLLLLALARVQRGEPRLAAYADIEAKLAALLRDFGRPRRSVHPEYPFWYLQNDGLWDVPEHDALAAAVAHRPRSKDVPPSILKKLSAHGGFPADIDAALRGDHACIHEIAARVLAEHFPPSIHEDILDAVGLHWEHVPKKRARDPAFRDLVLRVYERRCAVCGYDGRLGHSDLGLEAAHVRWHTHDGPDAVENGLSLCTFHHKVLDRGAIGIDDDRRVIVSQDVHGATGVDEWILRFHGAPLKPPQHGHPRPSLAYVRWHRAQVFRDPARLSP